MINKLCLTVIGAIPIVLKLKEIFQRTLRFCKFFGSLVWKLNCPCHLYWSIYHLMHNWAPRRLVYSILIWKIWFYFSFVFAICSSKKKTCHVTRDLIMEKVLSCWDNFNTRDHFHTLTKLSRIHTHTYTSQIHIHKE